MNPWALPIGTRVTVIASDNGHVGKHGTVVRYAHGFNCPYYVRLDGGPTILTGNECVKPID
jgi:hypothetical protein